MLSSILVISIWLILSLQLSLQSRPGSKVRRSEEGDNCGKETISLNKRKSKWSAQQVQGPSSGRSLALSKIYDYGSDEGDSEESLISEIDLVSESARDSDVEILSDPDANL